MVILADTTAVLAVVVPHPELETFAVSSILFVTPNETAGGAERHLLSLARELEITSDFEVHVAVLLPKSAATQNSFGLKHLHYIGRVPPLSFSGFRAATSFFPLQRLIAEIEPTHVYSCLEWTNILLGLSRLGPNCTWFAGLQNPIVARQQQSVGFLRKCRWKLHDLLLRRAAAVVVPSNGLIDDLRQLKVIQTKGITIPNAVDSSLGDDWQQRKVNSEFQLGFCGRLVAQKNPFAALRLVERLQQVFPVKLHVVGSGELKDSMQQYCQQRGISNSVVFHGFLDDRWLVLQDVDVLLSTSLFEGFGNILVEAMQHAVAVVAYDGPYGPGEIVEDGKTGFLVAVGDELALEETVCHLQANPNLLKEFAVNAKARAEQFSKERIASRFLNEVLLSR